MHAGIAGVGEYAGVGGRMTSGARRNHAQRGRTLENAYRHVDDERRARHRKGGSAIGAGDAGGATRDAHRTVAAGAIGKEVVTVRVAVLFV
jgi:hypothetical protein